MGSQRSRAAVVGGHRWYALYCILPPVTRLKIHVHSHRLEDLAFGFRSGDVDNFRRKSLLRGTARELTNGSD